MNLRTQKAAKKAKVENSKGPSLLNLRTRMLFKEGRNRMPLILLWPWLLNLSALTAFSVAKART